MEFIHEDRFPVYEIEAITTDEGRRYKIPDTDELYESVTTALGNQPGKKESLMEWRRRVGEEEANRISRKASSRGTKVHWMLENYLNGADEYELTHGQMPDAVQMFAQIKPILDIGIQKVYMQESPLWSHKYRLAGRVDLVAECTHKLSIVDFKTSAKPKKRDWITDYFKQGAAYSFMMEEMYGARVEQVVIMIAVENDIPQIFIENPYKYTDDEFFLERLK